MSSIFQSILSDQYDWSMSPNCIKQKTLITLAKETEQVSCKLQPKNSKSISQIPFFSFCVHKRDNFKNTFVLNKYKANANGHLHLNSTKLSLTQ